MNAEEHRTLRESLGVHALGQLPPAEATALRAHLDGCAACSAELAEIAPVVGSLGRVDPAHLDTVPAPPAWLGDRIVARAAAERVPSRPGRGGRLLLAAAAVVLAGLAGAGGYALGTGGDPAVPREPVALRTADPAVEASATVVPHTWGVEITLAADGFRPGAVYRVVVIDDGGRAVGAGEFVGTGASPMLCNLNSSVLRADAAGFDVVDAAGRVVVHGEL